MHLCNEAELGLEIYLIGSTEKNGGKRKEWVWALLMRNCEIEFRVECDQKLRAAENFLEITSWSLTGKLNKMIDVPAVESRALREG